jgi:cyclic pyranopterin phosphate synthase
MERFMDDLVHIPITGVNLSIDSLQKERFHTITRRDVFESVMRAMDALEASPIKLKLNAVVQSGINTDEIVDFIELTKQRDLDVRFIEEMPFNGEGSRETKEVWDYNRIWGHIQQAYDQIEQVPAMKSSTSVNFNIPGYKGNFGIIPAFTRTICDNCNRIRITATGMFKNCLFDDGVFNLRDFIRKGASDDDLKELFLKTVKKKPENGFVAEAARADNLSESMSTIGG